MALLNALWFAIATYQAEVMSSLGAVLRNGPGMELAALAMALGAALSE